MYVHIYIYIYMKPLLGANFLELDSVRGEQL